MLEIKCDTGPDLDGVNMGCSTGAPHFCRCLTVITVNVFNLNVHNI